MGEKPPAFPPSLSSIPTELDRLYDELGGPAPIFECIDRQALVSPCHEYFFARTWPVYRDWVGEETKAKRYWPWIALVADQYRFERQEKGKYEDEPKPSEVSELIDSIATGAHTLCNDLSRLQELSYRLDDPEFPQRRRHLAWMHERISQSLLGGPRDEVDDDPAVELAAHVAIRQLYERLVWVECTAKAIARGVSPELLTRRSMQADRGLGNLVPHAAIIWEAMTDRPASVRRVERRPGRNSGSDKPDFARFVTNVSILACAREPSLKEIGTALSRPQRRRK